MLTVTPQDIKLEDKKSLRECVRSAGFIVLLRIIEAQAKTALVKASNEALKSGTFSARTEKADDDLREAQRLSDCHKILEGIRLQNSHQTVIIT